MMMLIRPQPWCSQRWRGYLPVPTESSDGRGTVMGLLQYQQRTLAVADFFSGMLSQTHSIGVVVCPQFAQEKDEGNVGKEIDSGPSQGHFLIEGHTAFRAAAVVRLQMGSHSLAVLLHETLVAVSHGGQSKRPVPKDGPRPATKVRLLCSHSHLATICAPLSKTSHLIASQIGPGRGFCEVTRFTCC